MQFEYRIPYLFQLWYLLRLWHFEFFVSKCVNLFIWPYIHSQYVNLSKQFSTDHALTNETKFVDGNCSREDPEDEHSAEWTDDQEDTAKQSDQEQSKQLSKISL